MNFKKDKPVIIAVEEESSNAGEPTKDERQVGSTRTMSTIESAFTKSTSPQSPDTRSYGDMISVGASESGSSISTTRLEMLRQRRDKVVENYRARCVSPPLEIAVLEKKTSSHADGRPKVSFSSVEIRFYRRIMGDNPSVSAGPAVGIDWKFDKSAILSMQVDDYEHMKTYRCEESDIALSRREREEILLGIGYSKSQIADNVRHMIKTKHQRRQTVNNLAVSNVEEAIEKARRKVGNLFVGKNKSMGAEKCKNKESVRPALHSVGSNNSFVSSHSSELSDIGSADAGIFLQNEA
eukprot:scaffold4051_cov52-Attheya_sp.AAC.2